MYYGKYRAEVVKVNKKTGEIKVKCDEVYGDYESPWCTPCIPFIALSSRLSQITLKDDSKLTISDFLPKVKDNVWIEFEEGNCQYPIWCGTWID